MSEKIGKFEISELLELSKKTPQSALVLAHGEGLLEGIERVKQRLALKDLEIMRLREALATIGSVNITQEPEWDMSDNNGEIWGMYVYRVTTSALSTPTTYDDLMAWHEAQLGEPVAYMLIEDGFPMFYKNKSPEATFSNKFWEMYRREIKPLYTKKG